MIDNDGALALFVSKVVRLLNSLIAEEALLISRVAVGLKRRTKRFHTPLPDDGGGVFVLWHRKKQQTHAGNRVTLERYEKQPNRNIRHDPSRRRAMPWRIDELARKT